MSVSLDTLYTAETPEGIALSLRPAGVVSRFYAFLIDLAVRGGILFVAAIVLGVLGRMGGALFLILFFGLEWFYPVLFELMRGGATPGKKAMGLQVVMDSGLPITPAASLVRNLMRAADFLPAAYAFGFTCMLLRADFKRIGDLAAGTLVVYAKPVSLHGALPAAQPAAPARSLSPREQAAIIAWAGRSARITEARLDELAQLAAPVVGTANAGAHDATLRLLAVAQWLLGKR